MIFLFAWNVLFMGEKALSSVGDRCSSNYDCFNTYNKVCCFSSGCSSYSCVRKPCSTNGDCGGENECCKYRKCTTFGCVECQSNSNCGKFEHCCKRQYFSGSRNVCRRNCVGERCHLDSDCGGPGEYCTNNKICWKSGHSCATNHNCKGDGECCISGKCAAVGCPEGSHDTLAVWVTPVIVVCIVLFGLFIGGGWSYYSCHNLSRHRRVADENPSHGTTAVIALPETHANPFPPNYGSPPPPCYNHGQPLIFLQPQPSPTTEDH